MSQKVLSYDLGGTKIAAGVVTDLGEVLEETRVPIRLDLGKKAALGQLVTLGNEFLGRHPQIKKIGIASAGPLDPQKGELLDPTNFSRGGKLWGRVPLSAYMTQKLKRKTFLENDAAAAVLAEHWIGTAKKVQNVITLTLGTGLGTGIICNGILVRSGRDLHPEAGHMIIRAGDKSAPCGCGNHGCAEAFLSGRNFERRMRKIFPGLGRDAKEIAEKARKRDKRALAGFKEYSELMAVAVHNYVRMFSPEIIIFAGSFAASADLFLPNTEKELKKLLKRQRRPVDFMPKLTVSSLKNDSGLIGGAYVALHGQS